MIVAMAANDGPSAGNRGGGPWWQGLLRFGRKPALASAADLQGFISGEAALLAQKSAVEYCRAKTGLVSFALFEEPEFVKALAVCRWETFAEAAGDIAVMAEGLLRAPAGAAAPRLRRRLEQLYAAILAAYPLPAHRADGWDDVVEGFRRKLAAAAVAPPRHSAAIAMATARRLFATLPINPEWRQWDEELVHGAVCFRMVSVHQDLEKRIDSAALARDLASDAGP
jgi:hypothetical protein